MYGNDFSGIANALERAAYHKYAAPRRTPEQIAIETETNRALMEQEQLKVTRAEKKGYSGQRMAEVLAQATEQGVAPDQAQLLRLASNMSEGGDIASTVNAFLQHSPHASLDQRANSFLAMGSAIGEGDNYSIADRDAYRDQQARLDVAKTRTATLNKPLTLQQEIGRDYRRQSNAGEFSPGNYRTGYGMQSKPKFQTVTLPDGTTGRVDENDPTGRVGPFTELYRDEYGREAIRPVNVSGDSDLTAATQSIKQQSGAVGLSLSEGVRYDQLYQMVKANFGVPPDEYAAEWAALQEKIQTHLASTIGPASYIEAEVPTNAQLID